LATRTATSARFIVLARARREAARTRDPGTPRRGGGRAEDAIREGRQWAARDSGLEADIRQPVGMQELGLRPASAATHHGKCADSHIELAVVEALVPRVERREELDSLEEQEQHGATLGLGKKRKEEEGRGMRR